MDRRGITPLRLLLASALLVSAAACGSPAEPPPIRPPELVRLTLGVEGDRLVDTLGRQVILRGVNAGSRSKFAPFFPFPFAESGLPDQADEPPFAEAAAAFADRLASWGINVVRLPFSWEALEPLRGTYDDVYLERYETLVELFGARGIRTVVDFHQDVFARPFCGDGFPLWALPDPSMTPRADCSHWFTGYLGDPEVDAAFDRFWGGTDGLRAAFEEMWLHVAMRLGFVDGVLGWDVFNEPHYGTSNVDDWSRSVLGPFYQQLAARLSVTAGRPLMFFEPSGTDGADRATALVPPAGGGFVFALHYYSAAVFLLGPDDATYDVEADLAPWAAKAAEWGVPLLLGEFGCKTGTAGGARYLAANFAALDRFLFHGTAWEVSATHDDWNAEGYSLTRWGGEETPSVAALVRAYPRAVAGRITSFSFDAATRTGRLVYEATAGITELAAPTRLYPTGVAATVTGAGSRAAWDETLGLLLVETTGSGTVTVDFGPG
jgi:endoglycosylceramidase